MTTYRATEFTSPKPEKVVEAVCQHNRNRRKDRAELIDIDMVDGVNPEKFLPDRKTSPVKMRW
ncbi:MAG: hypothetical protein ABJL99_10795 [Aliishimia sp.]